VDIVAQFGYHFISTDKVTSKKNDILETREMINEKIGILENKISFATSISKFHHVPAFILFCTILTVICVLVAVAFFTLLERKILGVVQNRKGPSRVGFLGILQPIADGLKLFMKETIIPRSSIQLIFILAPVVAFILGFLG